MMEAFPSFLKDASSYWSASPLIQPSVGGHNDLIAFLSILQQCNVNILPISWQAGLPDLGSGAQSVVSQSLQNVQKSFAFKRAQNRSGLEAIFRAFISEVLALQRPLVQRHPNILNLEGVCLEVQPAFNSIWPALVFEKAPHGDLRSFMASESGRSLSLLQRVELCADIASAILTLHSCNIVHGDVKPENVLVFNNECGLPVPKVADFGFSCLGAKDTDVIKMPKTPPWEAPEWHDRGFPISAAKKADFYSFGLLCVWILFNDQLVEPSPDVSESIEGKMVFYLSKPNLELKERMEFGTLKSQDAISNLVEKIVRRSCAASKGQGEGLVEFFHSALCFNPSGRSLRLGNLSNTKHLEKITTSLSTSIGDSSSPLIIGEFSLAKSIYQLCRTEYPVRTNVVKSLEARKSQMSCPRCESECSLDAAFQLAFAYYTGFGVAKSYDEAYRQLEHSKRDKNALLAEIERVRTGSEVLSQHGLFEQLWLQGHIQTMSFSQSFRGTETREEIILHLTKELADVEESFGEESYVSTQLREVLSSILREGGKWAQAEKVEAHLADVRKRTLGLENEDTQRSLSKLSTIYRVLGRWEEAESIENQVLDYRMTVLGSEHTDTLTSIANLAAIRLDGGDPAEAVKLYNQVLKVETKLLGIEHMDTLLTMSNLAHALDELDEFAAAEKLHSTAAKLSAQIVGITNPKALDLLYNLALHYSKQGRWAETQKIAEEVVTAKREVLGERHPSTLKTMETLACALKHKGKLKEAEELLVQVMEDYVHLFGRKHPSTLTTMSNLADVLTSQDRLDEAQEYEEECMLMRTDVLGPTHRDTIVAIANLAYTYQGLGLLDKASALGESALEKAEAVLGTDHSKTLSIKGNLASTYRDQEKFHEARKLGREALNAQKRRLGSGHKSTIISMLRLAGVCEKMGLDEEAKELWSCAAQEVKKGGRDMVCELGLD